MSQEKLTKDQIAEIELVKYQEPVPGFELRGDQDHNPLHPQTPLHPSKEPYSTEQLAQLRQDAAEIIGRYPVKRSALLPMLHLVQSIDGYISGRGVTFCAEQLELTDAEVTGVATFYTQYKRHPNGDYTIGICTNSLCAIMGGDQIFEEVSEYLGIGNDETTADGKITLERIECNAACDYAPVVMGNWEFFDNMTPESTKELTDDLRAGKDVRPSRGPDKVCTFKQISRTLAGFPDGLANEGVGAGPATIEGSRLAQKMDWHAPDLTPDGMPADAPAQGGTPSADTSSDVPPVTGGAYSSTDTPAQPKEDNR